MFLVFIFIISNYAIAQDETITTACASPKQCQYNLNNPIPQYADEANIVESDLCYAKACRDVNPALSTPSDFHDVRYPGSTNNGNDNNCTVPTTRQCTDDISGLRYHVFYSNNITYSNTCKLPVVILFHGGSFADCKGNYLSSNLVYTCKEFVKRGFIAITVEYRLGVLLASNDTYTSQQRLAIWRAAQDARGAIRSIVKREINANQPYRIDLTKIFVGGNSAGSVTAMTASYYKPPMLATAFPSNISDPNVLGTLIQDFYYAETSSTYNYTIKGVLNMWGGIAVPKNTATEDYVEHPELFFFQNGNMPPPTIAFCGENDDTFMPDSKRLIFYSGANSNQTLSENYCLTKYPLVNTTYQVSPAANAYGSILGSRSIYKMLRSQQVYTEFYLDCQMAHGLDNDVTCITCKVGGVDTYPRIKIGTKCNECTPFASDFGTGLQTSTEVTLYIVKRAANFFQGVMNSALYNSYKTTHFIECANDRNSCQDNNSTTPACEEDNDSVSPVCQ